MNETHLSLDTGEVFYVSADLDCELPDDFEESDRYLQIPDKKDLDLGRRLLDEFVSARAPYLANDVADAFRRRGAYAKGKRMLIRVRFLVRIQERARIPCDLGLVCQESTLVRIRAKAIS